MLNEYEWTVEGRPDGKLRKPGDRIKLTDAQAKYHLQNGVLKPVQRPVKAASKSASKGRKQPSKTDKPDTAPDTAKADAEADADA